MRLAANICKIWLASMYLPLHQNHMYADISHCPFRAVFRSYLKWCLPVCIFILPHIKLNSQLLGSHLKKKKSLGEDKREGWHISLGSWRPWDFVFYAHLDGEPKKGQETRVTPSRLSNMGNKKGRYFILQAIDPQPWKSRSPLTTLSKYLNK